MPERNHTIFQGIVMYQRTYKEKDLMVKILTKQAGKRMFYIKNGKSKRYPYAAEIQPLTIATFEGVLNEKGLSFIDEVKEAKLPTQLMLDVERNAYATYILGLLDAAFVDNQNLLPWYERAERALRLLNDQPDFDAQGLANWFELHLLTVFGIGIKWDGCVIDGRRDIPLDFSEKYNGVLCQEHWQLDEQRMHAEPRAVRLLMKLAETELKNINSLVLKTDSKTDMARILDKIYDDQVGIHLKAKSFIQQLNDWQNKLIDRKAKRE